MSQRSHSIIICTMNRPLDLGRCLESLAKQRRHPEQTIIVDAGRQPAEAPVEAFRKGAPDCEVVHLRAEPGLTRQRNMGIEKAAGDVVHFLDDDTRVSEFYVEAVAAVFDGPEQNDVVGVSPMIREEGRMSAASRTLRRLFLLPHSGGTGRVMASGYGSYPWNTQPGALMDISVACGCCAWRRSLFDLVRFDEHFEGYGYMEDLEFAIRALAHGRIILQPEALVWHFASYSGRMSRRELARMQVRNHRYVFRKHKPQDAVHRAAFYWSLVGDGLLRGAAALTRGDWDSLVGWVEGLVKKDPRAKEAATEPSDEEPRE
jgi:GT2 family glycosyltransferase